MKTSHAMTLLSNIAVTPRGDLTGLHATGNFINTPLLPIEDLVL